jgi:protein-L-isoaspartate O-methyltransferase
MTLDSYNAAEREALSRLSNRQIEASGAEAFKQVGYPVTVDSMAALPRYADVMQEGRSRATYDMLGGLTAGEFNLVEQITAKVQKATDRLGRSVTPTASLLRALVVYRQIAALFPDHASVLEIGPGSGYVSALLALDTYKVYSVEIAQAFALWQRQLRQTMPDADWTHIPWWDWIDGRAPEKLDCITANHCLNEMHPNALAYLIRRAEEILGTTGILIFESLGSEVVRTNRQTLECFVRRGWTAAPAGHCVAMLPPGNPAKYFDSMVYEPLSRTWDDLVRLWGGEPMTSDERFLSYCEGK